MKKGKYLKTHDELYVERTPIVNIRSHDGSMGFYPTGGDNDLEQEKGHLESKGKVREWILMVGILLPLLKVTIRGKN